MTRPARPGVPTEGPLTDPGPPEPVRAETLADPSPNVLDPPQPDVEPDLPEPTEESAAAPPDSQVILVDGDSGCTVLAYLREVSADGVVVHLMATADGPETLDLAQLVVTLLLEDQPVPAAPLPHEMLEMGTSWEADLTFDAPGVELAPGESILELRLGDAPSVYATV